MTVATRNDARKTLHRSAVARYIQLAALFRRRIESGVWPADSQIPTINDLVEEFGVARATVRQALGLLEEEGLLARFRAKGTFVLEQRKEEFWCQLESDWSGLLTARPDSKIKLLSTKTVKAPPFVPHPIGQLAPSYLHLRRRHSRNDKPFLIADIYLASELGMKLPRKMLSTQTAMRLAANLPGVSIADARQSITIGAADFEVASDLEIPLNAPVANVSRTVLDSEGQLVLIGMGCYRGDVFRVDIKLR